MRCIYRFALAAMLLGTLLFASLGFAQQGSSAVRGTVVDQQSSVIPNATVTLTSLSTGAVRSQKTGPTGAFSFDLVQPGQYRLEAEAASFKKAVLDKVDALVDRPTDLTLKLLVGATTESVTVEASSAAVQVNTQDSSLGNNFESKQIQQLPLEARNVISLLSLQPGVTGDGSVSGARSDQSNVTLDGININDAETNQVAGTNTGGGSTGITGGPVLRLNGDAIEEFRVNTSTSNSAAARSSGAQISLVTKSGTNSFHGDVFEYNRNTIFSANDWFNNHNGVARPALIRNTYGASLGGPILKNKLFFFASYEGRKDRSQAGQSAVTVPLPSLAAGVVKFNGCTATGASVAAEGGCAKGSTTLMQLTSADIAKIFPDVGVNPAALTGLAQGAAFKSNSSGVGDGLNTAGFTFNAATPVNLNSTTVKFDYNLTSHQTASVRMNYLDDHSATAARFPGGTAPTAWNHPEGIAFQHVWTISDNLVSNFKYGITRQAFTSGGDTHADETYFRLVYQPTNLTYDIQRVSPVHNFVEDLSLVHGNHTLQFGGQVTLVNNGTDRFSKAFSTATTNPSGYKTNLISNSINQYLLETFGTQEDSGSRTNVENAVTALIGRFNNYSANFLYNSNGSILPAGNGANRHFATQGYEGYIQDNWKVSANLNLTVGLRYNIWRPVYETQGFEVQPTISFSQIFADRIAAMNAGKADLTDIVINKSGPVNGGPSLYKMDKTDFLPRFGFAWSPKGDSFWTKWMGSGSTSVIRGGFAMVPDYFGEAVATFFDRNNTLGFSASTSIPVNTFNVGCGHFVVTGNGLNSCTSNPGPLFQNFNGNVRTMPLVPAPAPLTFPLQLPDVSFPTQIQEGLDSGLVTPKNYIASLTYEREMPHHGKWAISYVGRFSRNLLAQRDVATPAGLLKDPTSGQTMYQAGTILEKARQAGVPLSQVGVAGGAVPTLPFFEHFFPLANVAGFCNGGCKSATQAWYADALSNTNDWTTTELDFENLSNIGPHAFYQPQYGAIVAWSTVAYSNYHSLQTSYQWRLNDLTLDFNYTYSHSMDNASGLQGAGSYSNSALILNPFRPQDNYTASDFDQRHVVTMDYVWNLPFGKGKRFASGANNIADAIIGGWRLSGIYRWNSGEPLGAPYDSAQWATNWEVQSYTTVANTSGAPVNGCNTRLVATPQFFGSCQAQAFAALRPSYPGDTGDRNYFRLPHYTNLDAGLAKIWIMPYNEHHNLEFRWEAFNVTNSQAFTGLDFSRSGFGIPGSVGGNPPVNFSNWISDNLPNNVSPARNMQFGLTYRF